MTRIETIGELLEAAELALRAIDNVMSSHEGQSEHAELMAAFKALETALNNYERAPPTISERLLKAAHAHVTQHPVFASSPIGAPGSVARSEQDAAIASEKELRAALAAYSPQSGSA